MLSQVQQINQSHLFSRTKKRKKEITTTNDQVPRQDHTSPNRLSCINVRRISRYNDNHNELARKIGVSRVVALRPLFCQ